MNGSHNWMDQFYILKTEEAGPLCQVQGPYSIPKDLYVRKKMNRAEKGSWPLAWANIVPHD